MGGALFLLFSRIERPRKFDERFTLKRQHKIPYGTYASFQLLQTFFPSTRIYTGSRPPGKWDSLSPQRTRQAILIITQQFLANETEWESLIEFASAGNQVLISSVFFSDASMEILQTKVGFSSLILKPSERDTAIVELLQPPFESPLRYGYPGMNSFRTFSSYNEEGTELLGRGHAQKPNFLHFATGRGHIYIHTAPETFTNYFLLHRDNISYLEKLISVIPNDTEKILWDEYFFNKRVESAPRNPNWLTVLFNYPSLKWGLLTALLTLLVFVLLGARRRQRMIPLIKPPVNDSLDFVKTIGRLYYDRKDHRNLSLKMSAYFLEHVRVNYRINTSSLDEVFVNAVHARSGYDRGEIAAIAGYINGLQSGASPDEQQLQHFHRKLEKFYKST